MSRMVAEVGIVLFYALFRDFDVTVANHLIYQAIV